MEPYNLLVTVIVWVITRCSFSASILGLNVTKSICQFKKKKAEAKENSKKNEKALRKLMNNALYGKTMKNVRNIIDVRLVSNKTCYSKCPLKPSYMQQK